MFFALVVLIAVIAVASSAKIFEEDFHRPAVTAELVAQVNAAKSTWQAAIPMRFANATVADVKRMLGTIMPGEDGYVELKEKTSFKTLDTEIPTEFDVRTAWPQCAAIAGHVRDQSSCGSCWAFGSTEAFNDRHCIATGDATTLFSPEDTLACCTGVSCSFSAGCNGGQPAGAWNWFTKTGVVSGGDYADIGKGTTCKPYSMESCAHHVAPTGGIPACDSLPEYKTPKCTSSCSESAYGTAFSKDKHYASDSYSIKGVSNIQKEIMEKGTVSVALTVYEDFETYSSGVYQHVTGKSLGGHAIKMIGWGVENGTPYWLCVNSWNPTWGLNGMFKILRGSNECGIEGSVVAGTV